MHEFSKKWFSKIVDILCSGCGGTIRDRTEPNPKAKCKDCKEKRLREYHLRRKTTFAELDNGRLEI
jgi:hypothetical protein